MSHIYKKPERHTAKKRWEYLRAKGTAYSILGVSVCVFGLGLVVGTLTVLFLGAMDLCGNGGRFFQGLLFLGPWIAAWTIIELACLLACKCAETCITDLAFVPSVHQQITRLPDDDVLLRGSDAPGTGREELLRAAQAIGGEPSKELLRADCNP